MVLALLYKGVGEKIKVIVPLFIWLLIVGVVSYYFLLDKSPIYLPLMVLISVLIVSQVYHKTDLDSLDLRALLAIHIFRIPIELILLKLYLQGEIPKIMTFEGWNFDITIGITALVLLSYTLFLKKDIPRKLLLVWNWVGVLFLITIVVLAFLSAPLPFQQFGLDQPNVAVLRFPFTYLPSVVVPIVFLSHFLSIKKLRKKSLKRR